MNRAFAPIEILIVVLIVAVLAVAAIPKQRERRALSQYASCRADMYSLAMAIEAYHVEWDDYPYFPEDQFASSGFMNSDNPETLDLWSGYTPWTLTTPVAYLHELPIDQYWPHDGILNPYGLDSPFKNLLRLYHYDQHHSGTFWDWERRVPKGAEYIILGIGSDRYTSASSYPDIVHNNILDFLWARPGSGFLTMYYDPTNGTFIYEDQIYTTGDIAYIGPDVGFEPTRYLTDSHYY